MLNKGWFFPDDSSLCQTDNNNKSSNNKQNNELLSPNPPRKWGSEPWDLCLTTFSQRARQVGKMDGVGSRRKMKENRKGGGKGGKEKAGERERKEELDTRAAGGPL